MADNLEIAQRAAIKLLASLPTQYPGAELSISKLDHEIWLGVGWLVGKGWAVYRGEDCYRFSVGGRIAAEEWLKD